MNRYKVSVVVPCYQVEKYIADSVLSIKNQDFDNFEIILVDDGCKDQSVEVAQEVLSGFEHVKIVKKKNGGLPSARNAGIKESEGKYICFIDSDDIVSSSHLKDLYNLCESNNLEVSFSLFESTDENNRSGSYVKDVVPVVICREHFLNKAMDRRLKVHCCSLLINRAFLLNNNLFFNEELRYAEDTEYRWRLFPKLDRVGCTNKATYKYLTRNNSLMTSQNVDRVLYALDTIKKTTSKNILEYPDDKKLWELLPKRAYLAFCRSLARAASYETFIDFTIRSKPPIDLSFVLRYRNKKVKLMALIFILSKRLFYQISKI